MAHSGLADTGMAVLSASSVVLDDLVRDAFATVEDLMADHRSLRSVGQSLGSLEAVFDPGVAFSVAVLRERFDLECGAFVARCQTDRARDLVLRALASRSPELPQPRDPVSPDAPWSLWGFLGRAGTRFGDVLLASFGGREGCFDLRFDFRMLYLPSWACEGFAPQHFLYEASCCEHGISPAEAETVRALWCPNSVERIYLSSRPLLDAVFGASGDAPKTGALEQYASLPAAVAAARALG